MNDVAVLEGVTGTGVARKHPLYRVEDCDRLDIAEVHGLVRQYVNAARVDLLATFEFGNELVDWAEGAWIHTKTGKSILDFTGGIGVLNHGHNHPRILKVRTEYQQKKRMEVHRNYFSQYLAALSHNVAALLPGDLEYCFFPNSGSEAVDGALKTAYKYHDMKRTAILHSDVSFHGKLFASHSVTHSPENHYPYPKLPGMRMFAYDDIASVRRIVDETRDAKGISTVAGIICEPFNVSNMRPASDTFLRALRQLCTEEDIVLIFDEVYSGWCKTGPLFNFMRVEGLIPDVLCMAKSFGGGKASISGLVTRRPVFQKSFENPVSSNLQTTTYYGFGEETVTAIEALNIIVDDDYPAKSHHIGKRLGAGLARLHEKYPGAITGVRGSGALHGVFFNAGPSFLNNLISLIPNELYQDPRFMQKLVTAAVVSELYSRRDILTFTSLGLDVHLIVSPSLVVSDREIDLFLEGLDDVLSSGLPSLVLSFVKRKLRITRP